MGGYSDWKINVKVRYLDPLIGTGFKCKEMAFVMLLE